jgi:outer membrane beta-barrel protein
MGRAAQCAWLAAAILMSGPLALAQDKEASPPGGDEASPPAASPPGTAAEPPAEGAPEGANAPTPSESVAPTVTPQEIYAVPRRHTLKRRRVEIMPTYNVTINNPLVTHHGFGGQINIFLSEALFLGLEGTYYYRQPISTGDRYFLTGADQRVIPSVNQYNWSAFLDFGYVFAIGKFALFNKLVVHWDTYLSAGVGLFNTQIIPRDDPTSKDIFSNYLFAGLLPGLGTHIWFNRWFALDVYIKNYIFADNLEPPQRTPGDCTPTHDCSFSGDMNGVKSAKSSSQSLFTFDVTFGIGLSFFLPPGFEYRTPR